MPKALPGPTMTQRANATGISHILSDHHPLVPRADGQDMSTGARNHRYRLAMLTANLCDGHSTMPMHDLSTAGSR
jgi:hypothetical protein